MRASPRFHSAWAAVSVVGLLALSLFSPAHAAATPVSLSTCVGTSTLPNITIGTGPGTCGPSVYIDKSFTGNNGLGQITINTGGTLTIAEPFSKRQRRGDKLPTSIQIDTLGIVVNGTLQAGSSTTPYRHTATINFTSTTSTGSATITKGIMVNSGGRLLLYGKTGVAQGGANGASPSWTHLSAPAGPPAQYGAGLGVAAPVGASGATVLQIARAVDWQPGNWIVVAGTDFSPDSAEFVRLQSVSCTPPTGPCALTLDPATPLVNYHYGGTAPSASTGTVSFTDGVARNYGVDERAEVGLISRNIRLTAAVPSTGTGTATANGGEIMIMGGFGQVAIQGVEIEKFGKGQKGSYPIHFHMAGTVTAAQVLIDSNSIHHSYNKCVTLHSTSGVTISNNVCARAVGHLFYLEMGDETGNSFINNLGIGAMSNAMSNPSTVTTTAYPQGTALAGAAFWRGDYLVNGTGGAPGNSYNGFNVPFTDEGTVNGTSTAATGFWIPNLSGNTFTGNSVAGCQAFGRGFWLLPATASAATGTGTFANNRAHGCYAGFDTASDDGVTGALLYTPQGPCLVGSQKGKASNCDVVAHFDRLTATRNRNRGIWVRASWYGLTNARLATNRDSVSLVSSGGTEGSPPGEWSLLRDAIIVGISANNVLRFGPCPYNGQNGFGGNAGCYEAAAGNGYPQPSWNFAGMMFYDGPARLEQVHFVNFNQDIKPYLTTSDLTYLNDYTASGNFITCHNKPFVYEGDAAMGWFQSNENSYPPTQYVEGLSFYNVDLRHQVYTQNVELTCATTPAGTSLGNFRDGDKFTVILDRDSSLTGFQVVPAGTPTTRLTPMPGVYPISLNNIPFLAGPGTADECLSTGQQDLLLEGRPTSLISPYSYATLEFSALTAPCNGTLASYGNCLNNNVMVFTKDQLDYGGTQQFSDTVILTNPTTGTNTVQTFNCGGPSVPNGTGTVGHACVALSGRNGNGVYEPKVVNGLGYTVGATAGMPNFVSLMYGDASVPGGISATNPFSTRVGICYKNQGQAAPPASAFTVRKGGKSFASVNNANGATLAPNYFNALQCTSLDNTMCIASGTPDCYTSLCPSPPLSGVTSTASLTPTLPQVTSMAALNDKAQCPNGECFFYDQASGLLFINMVQEKPNAGGPYSSPLGTCSGTAGTSSELCAQDNFYSCPAGGCQLYTVSVNTASYTASAPSDCTPYGTGAANYTQPYPADLPRLAYASNGTAITTTLAQGTGAYPHRALLNAPAGFCPVNAPSTPDWPPSPGGQTLLTLSGPASGVAISVAGVQPVAGLTSARVPLAPGATYTFTATGSPGCSTSGDQSCACQQVFSVNAAGTTATSPQANCCALGPGPLTSTGSFALGNRTLSVGGAPFNCAGPNPPPPPPPGSGFSLGLPNGITATVSLGTALIAVTPSFALTPGQTYTLAAKVISPLCSATSAPFCSCQQSFTVTPVTGAGFTSTGTCCGMPPSGGKTLPIAGAANPDDPPFACKGP